MVSSDGDYGGRPVLQCNGDGLSSASFTALAHPTTVVVVGEASAGYAFGSNGVGLIEYTYGTATWMLYAGQYLFDASNDRPSSTSPALFIAELNGTQSKLYYDSPLPFVAGDAGANTVDSIYVGGSVGGGVGGFVGKIAELIVLDRVLTSAEIDVLRAYVGARYGIGG